MSCNTKINSINKLKSEGVIDSHGNILDKEKFNVLNASMSRIAENKYGVDLEGKQLFTLTRFKYKATDEEFFNKLDAAVNAYVPPVRLKDLEDSNKKDIFYIANTERSKKNDDDSDINLERANHTIFNGKLGLQEQFDATEIISNISNNYRDLEPSILDIIGRLQKLSAFTNAKVKVTGHFTGDLKDAAMAWDSDRNLILMSIENLSNRSLEKSMMEFLHEVTHSTSVHAYVNPSDDIDKRIFRQAVDDIYNEYKLASGDSDSYGFTQPVEFIAEFYSNNEFREEVKRIYSDNKRTLFEKFVDAIRSLLGLPTSSKNTLNYTYNDVIATINDIAHQNESELQGFEIKNILKVKNESEEDVKISTLETIEQKQDLVLDRIKASLAISLDEYKKYIKRNKDENSAKLQKVKKSAEEFEDLKDKIEEYSKEQKWKAIITFTKTMNSNLTKLQERLKKEDLTREDARSAIERYENYLAAYNLLDEVSELIADEQYHNSDRVSKKDRSRIEKLIADTAGKHKVLTNNFKAAIKTFVTKDLSTIQHQPEVERKWRDKLTEQYNNLGITNKTLDEYIVQEMNDTYADEIQEEVNAAANKAVNEISFDISAATKYVNSAINTNSKLVQIFQNILNDIRESIITAVRDNDSKLRELFDKFSKERSGKASKMYENLLDKDSDGNYHLKGEYKAEFYSEWQKNIQEGGKPLKKWLAANTDLIVKNGKPVGRKPADKWKNDLSNLSEVEKEVLDFFKQQLQDGNKKTFGIKSLVNNFYDASFYRLPAITQSDFERVLERDAKGIVTDKWKDLTQIRPDDIGYQERSVRVDNSSINYVPIHYRGNINPKDQSLDLFTIMRLEFQNAQSYSIKQSKELELSNIIDVAKQKRYVKTTGVRVPIIGKLFGGNVQTIKGTESETYKRLQSLMERNIYDVLHIYTGNIGKIDVNKAIKLANSWTATVGLSLNAFSATANALNGNLQLFMETVGKGVFNGKDLAKANKKYAGDTAANMLDLKQPIKTSLTNQLNQEFDTFGIATVSEQSFIRSSYAKSFADPSSLQFMHQAGEHQMQSTLTMAVLNSVKVLDGNGKQIKNDNKSDMTLLDAYSVIDGKLTVDPRVVYTSHTPSIKYNEGGKTQVAALIKKKVFDTMGNYDQQMQVEASRYAAGKLFLMYRKYLMPLGIRRFRGISTASKAKDKLKDKDRFFSHSLKDYEEGIYTSLIRHISQGAIPALKQMQYSILSKNWQNLTEAEKSNVKVAVTEIILTAVILPMLGGIISHLAEGADDEDEKYLYFAMYQLRRLESELAQYRNIGEAWKISRSPIPSIRILENATEALYRTVTPWTWDDKYKSGKRKGDLKIIRSYEKLIPVLNRVDAQAKEMYKYIDNDFGL